MALASMTPVEVLTFLIIVLFTILLESRLGLRKRVKLFYHHMLNTETRFKVEALYETDMVFENVQDELKSVFREHYGDIVILDDGSGSITIEVDQNFLVSLKQTDDDKISIETSKITSTMREMEPEMVELLGVLGDFEHRSANQVKKSDHLFEDTSFTAELYLPNNSTFIDTYLPRGVTLTSYQLDLDYPDYDCSIKDTGESTKIITHHRTDLKTILSRIMTPWAIWWKRMR